MPKKILIMLAVIAFALAFVVARFWPANSTEDGTYIIDDQLVALVNGSNEKAISDSSLPVVEKDPSTLISPIAPIEGRITKKPFGIYITPKDSPVNPEKFTGYHTGVDFEIFAGEEDLEVPIFVACTGKLLFKEYVSGYGGVAVQSCNLNNQPVTVLYGHLKLESISATVGQELTEQHPIGVLGKGYSPETDGERKHLHFSIHLGSNVELKGYVKNKADLESWLDPVKYFNK